MNNNQMINNGGVKSVGAVMAELIPVVILALLVNYVFLNPVVPKDILDNAASVTWECQEDYSGTAKVDKKQVSYELTAGKTYECKMGDKYFNTLIDLLRKMKGRSVKKAPDVEISESFVVKAGSNTHTLSFGGNYVKVDDQWYRVYMAKFTGVYCFMK